MLGFGVGGAQGVMMNLLGQENDEPASPEQYACSAVGGVWDPIRASCLDPTTGQVMNVLGQGPSDLTKAGRNIRKPTDPAFSLPPTMGGPPRDW